MESQDAEATPAAVEAEAQDAKYGIRVAVSPDALEVRSLGSFDVVDVDGNLSVVSVSEALHATSAGEEIRAVSYSFERQAVGKLSTPKLWSFLSVFSGAFLITLLGFNILKPELEFGIPSWAYYLIGGIIFLISTAMELKRVGEFIVLSVSHSGFGELEKNYGRSSIIDLPPGRLVEVQSKLEAALKTLPPSRVTIPTAALDLADLSNGTEQRGRAHGEAS